MPLNQVTADKRLLYFYYYLLLNAYYLMLTTYYLHFNRTSRPPNLIATKSRTFKALLPTTSYL